MVARLRGCAVLQNAHVFFLHMNLRIAIVGLPNAVPAPSLLQSGGLQPRALEERWCGMALFPGIFTGGLSS